MRRLPMTARGPSTAKRGHNRHPRGLGFPWTRTPIPKRPMAYPLKQLTDNSLSNSRRDVHRLRRFWLEQLRIRPKIALLTFDRPPRSVRACAC
jgi:hypothetical protein